MNWKSSSHFLWPQIPNIEENFKLNYNIKMSSYQITANDLRLRWYNNNQMLLNDDILRRQYNTQMVSMQNHLAQQTLYDERLRWQYTQMMSRQYHLPQQTLYDGRLRWQYNTQLVSGQSNLNDGRLRWHNNQMVVRQNHMNEIRSNGDYNTQISSVPDTALRTKASEICTNQNKLSSDNEKNKIKHNRRGVKMRKFSIIVTNNDQAVSKINMNDESQDKIEANIVKNNILVEKSISEYENKVDDPIISKDRNVNENAVEFNTSQVEYSSQISNPENKINRTDSQKLRQRWLKNNTTQVECSPVILNSETKPKRTRGKRGGKKYRNRLLKKYEKFYSTISMNDLYQDRIEEIVDKYRNSVMKSRLEYENKEVINNPINTNERNIMEFNANYI